jgi:hypothetical protein
VEGVSLRVTVRDEGEASGDDAGADGALPLPLVAALSETVELRRLKPPSAPGAEVTMTFALDTA